MALNLLHVLHDPGPVDHLLASPGGGILQLVEDVGRAGRCGRDVPQAAHLDEHDGASGATSGRRPQLHERVRTGLHRQGTAVRDREGDFDLPIVADNRRDGQLHLGRAVRDLVSRLRIGRGCEGRVVGKRLEIDKRPRFPPNGSRRGRGSCSRELPLWSGQQQGNSIVSVGYVVRCIRGKSFGRIALRNRGDHRVDVRLRRPVSE